MTATLITGPAIEPVSLDDVKAHLRLDGTDEDRLLHAAIISARIHVEVATRRALVRQQWRIYLDDWPPGRTVSLPVSPVIAVDQVTFYDVAGVPRVWDAANYRVDAAGLPARIIARMRPEPALYDNGVEIDVTAGYGVSSIDVPAPLRQAVLILVTHWYEHRGLIGHDFAGAIAPHGFEALIAPYRAISL